MMPEQRETLYDSIYSSYTQHFCDIWLDVRWIIFSDAFSLQQEAEQDDGGNSVVWSLNYDLY